MKKPTKKELYMIIEQQKERIMILKLRLKHKIIEKNFEKGDFDND